MTGYVGMQLQLQIMCASIHREHVHASTIIKIMGRERVAIRKGKQDARI